MEPRSRTVDTPYSTLLVYIPHYCGRGQAVLYHEGCEREPLWASGLALLDAVHMGYGVRGRHGRKKRAIVRTMGRIEDWAGNACRQAGPNLLTTREEQVLQVSL